MEGSDRNKKPGNGGKWWIGAGELGMGRYINTEFGWSTDTIPIVLMMVLIECQSEL